MIEITTDGKRILCRFPYDRRLVEQVKKIPGARPHYEKVEGGKDVFKEWRCPLTMDTCRMFRRVFKDQLDIRPALAKWASEEVKRESRMEQFREDEGESAALLTSLPEEAPDALKAMCNRHYQLSGAAFMLHGKHTILADDPGLGKTIQTLAAVIQSGAKNILVGCRRTATRTVWERETLRWAPTIQPYVAQGSHADRERAMAEFAADPLDDPNSNYWDGEPPKHKMLIVNIEMIRAKRIVICPQGLGDKCPAYKVGECKHKYEAEYQWPFLFETQWDAIILDESHNLLASTANYQSKRITQGRYGAVHLRRHLNPDGLAIALSGTWTRSKLPKAWGTLNWVNPERFSSYWQWAGAHFGVEEGTYGKVVAQGVKVPKPIDQVAFDAMLRPYVLRRTKDKVVKDLPPIIYAGTPISDEPDAPCYVQIDMEPAQEKIYKQIRDDAEADLEGGVVKPVGTLAVLTRLRQLANASGRLEKGKVLPTLPSNKMDWILEFMEERRDSGQKVVIASSFTEMVELVDRCLIDNGFETVTLSGKTSDRDRSDIVAMFQDTNDPLQVVVLNTHAGGESITLDAADEMVIVDGPWLSDTEDQLTARIHRVSRIHQVTVYRLASVGTVDTWIAGMTDEQREALVSAAPRKLSDMLKEEEAA